MTSAIAALMHAKVMAVGITRYGHGRSYSMNRLHRLRAIPSVGSIYVLLYRVIASLNFLKSDAFGIAKQSAMSAS